MMGILIGYGPGQLLFLGASALLLTGMKLFIQELNTLREKNDEEEVA